MIRRMNTIEQITIGYLVYFTMTLFFAPGLFINEKSDLYKALLKLFKTQEQWILVGTAILSLYFISAFIRKHFLAMIANIAGGCFFLMVCVTYMFTYPNIGAGIYLFVAIKCFHEVFKISNRYENIKTERLKAQMNCKQIISNNEEEVSADS